MFVQYLARHRYFKSNKHFREQAFHSILENANVCIKCPIKVISVQYCLSRLIVAISHNLSNIFILEILIFLKLKIWNVHMPTITGPKSRSQRFSLNAYTNLVLTGILLQTLQFDWLLYSLSVSR